MFMPNNGRRKIRRGELITNVIVLSIELIRAGRYMEKDYYLHLLSQERSITHISMRASMSEPN